MFTEYRILMFKELLLPHSLITTAMQFFNSNSCETTPTPSLAHSSNKQGDAVRRREQGQCKASAQ